MATLMRKNAQKSMFLKQYLVDHPDAGTEATARAWQAAGNEGTISQSLIGKVRKELGLTDKGSARRKSRAQVGAAKRRSADSKSNARGARPDVRGRTPVKESSTTALPKPPGGDRSSVLIRLEGAIDDLLHEIKRTGGLPEFEDAVRKARRILIRSHGE